MAAKPSDRSRSGFGANIPGVDQFVWYFIRVSGLALVVLALGHIFITHYVNVPSDTTFDFVSKRWANPLWRSFDWLLLLLALWHGMLGLRISISDYVRKPGWNLVANAVAWLIAVIFTVLGTVTIISFNEEMSRTNSGPLSGNLWIADVIGALLVLIAIGTYVGILAAIIWVAKNLKEGRAPIYRGDPGQYAWVFHRLTGIGVVFFLLVHIIDIMLIGLGRDIYDKSVAFYSHWYLIPMEIALVGALVYHALNGIRIILIDFWSQGSRKERQLFWLVLASAAILTIPSAIIIILNEL